MSGYARCEHVTGCLTRCVEDRSGAGCADGGEGIGGVDGGGADTGVEVEKREEARSGPMLGPFENGVGTS